MRHRSKHTLFDVGKHQKSKTRTSSTFTLGKNSHLTKKNNKLHSKSTYFYRWGSRLNYVVPSACALALLIGGIVAINPDVNQVYAEEGNGNNGVSNVDGDAEVMPLTDSSISLSFNGTPTLTEEVTAGEVAYITNTFTVNANKQTGFTLQLSAMNGSSTELRGKDNAMATIKGVGENVSPANFANNTWGYSYQENPNTALNPKTIAEGLTYSSMPAYGTEKSIANKTLTGVANENTTYLLAFAAKIGTDSPADHYIGNFLLSVVGSAFNPKTYTLTYDANNGTNPPATTSCTQASVGANCDITISSSTPSREGFTFLGWADSNNAAAAQYAVSSTITMSANKTVYAVWKSNGPFNGITKMQDMKAEYCTKATPGQSAILEDDRDGKKYYVTRTADGNCWMTQNLAYDGGGTQQCNLNGGTTCSNWPNSNDSVARYAKGAHTDGSHSSQGNFYSWEAAMNGNAGNTQGVCPNNWQLPTSNNTNSKSFGGLTGAYGIGNNADGSTKLRGNPLYFRYSGYIANGMIYDSSRGYYWSSTPDGNGHAFLLTFDDNVVRPSFSTGDGYGLGSFRGHSVRCVAK